MSAGFGIKNIKMLMLEWDRETDRQTDRQTERDTEGDPCHIIRKYSTSVQTL